MIPTPEQQAAMQQQQQPAVPAVPVVPDWQKQLGAALGEIGKNWQQAPPPQQAPTPQLGNRNQAMQMLIQDKMR